MSNRMSIWKKEKGLTEQTDCQASCRLPHTTPPQASRLREAAPDLSALV